MMRRKCKRCGRVSRVMFRNGENNYCSSPCALVDSGCKLANACDFCHELLTGRDSRAVVFVKSPAAKVYCSIECALKDCGFEDMREDLK